MSASFKGQYPEYEVRSSAGNYIFFVGQGLCAPMLSCNEGGQVIADEFFRARFQALWTKPVLIEANEHAKSLDRMPGLIEQLRLAGANRSTEIAALGGGVIQDISSFVASVYMRGLPWIYLPTTVLAMVDSCIGGKSSINVGPYKNLVGTFHPPKTIYIDPTLAETLPRDQFASGLIEAAKICFCRGPEAFATHLACEPSTTMSTDALERVIVNSLLAKKHFIEIDEFDKKERLLLNFGHTFGHAIEGASDYGIPHGIAVGLGILCSLAFQRSRGVTYSGVPIVAELERHLDTMIRTLPGLRDVLANVSLSDVMERFASDKKHRKDVYSLILVGSTGEVVLEQIARSPELEARLREAIQTTIEAYSR